MADFTPIPNEFTNGNASSDANIYVNKGNSAANGHSINAATAQVIPPKPIAICGMACRLPSGIKTPQQLWEFLLAGGDARSKVPESRYNIEAFYDPSGKPGTTKTQHGYFLDEDLANLDTSFFSMPRKEVERIDPQQRLMLEVARECFEDGGEIGWRGKKIGCYAGNLGDDWLEMLAQDTQNFGIYRLSGYGDFSLSNRISYEMNLQGPSVTIRTACSSSMVALHEACVAIDRGDCESAIQGVLSPDGSCKTFSTGANGYARGEAIVGVFVKPLEDAIRDGNSIRAVIRATATNHDGKTAGFSLPSSDAQETMIRRAYEIAGLNALDTGYVECHGTGTSVGDPIETTAVARVFGEVGITIGSTKPNFDHTEGASGILSVLKTVLALENKTIPPSIKYSQRNPSTPWESGKLVLAEDPLAWPEGRLERVSVNSFGLGGSNAHAIIDSAASYRVPTRAQIGGDNARLLLYSANTQKSLTTLIDNYKTFIEETHLNVEDIVYTLARGKEHLPYRAFVLANGSSVGIPSPITKSGIEADAVVGHSSGEIAGAYAAGALTAGEAIVVALYRGVVARDQKKPGAMAALGMSVTDAERFLIPSTGIACDNSPRSVTISGDADKIGEVLTAIRSARPDILARKLQVDKAYHSYHMAEISDVYKSLIEQKLDEKSPKKLFFSSVESKLLDNSTTLGPNYWQKNLESPVLFNGAVSGLLRHFSNQDVVLLEVGPHSALAGPLTQIMAETPNSARYVPTIVRNQNSTENFLSAVGKLYTFHIPIDFGALFPDGSCFPDLPRYPFNHSESSHWFESRLSKEFRQRKYPHHDILGAKVVESTDLEPAWRNVLHVAYNTNWLKDHKVGDDIVFPFAGYVAMAGEAVRQTTKIDEAFRLRHISVGTAMLLSEDKPTEVITTLRPLRLTISQDSSYAEVKAEGGALPTSSSPNHLPRAIGWERWFAGVRREGLELGYDFQNVDGITASTTTHESRGTLFVARTSEDFVMNVEISNMGNGSTSSRIGDGKGVVNGNIVLKFQGLKITPASMTDDSVEGIDPHAASRLTWAADIDFVDLNNLFHISLDRKQYAQSLEELGNLSIFVINERLRNANIQKPHMERYAQWIDTQAKSFKISSCDNDLFSQRILQLHETLSTTPAAPISEVLNAIVSNIDPLLSGSVSSWESLVPADPAQSFYDFISKFDSSGFFKVLGHSKPNLRILEIGSWKRSPSTVALRSLTTPNGRSVFSQYTFASKNLIAIEERLTDYTNLEYVTLDIGEDLASQGFEDRQYDIVIANNVIHATHNLAQSLLNLKKLLTATGYLFLQELTPASRRINTILGTTPIWWRDITDRRADEMYINASNWQDDLKAAGFGAPKAVAFDSEESSRMNVVMVARPYSSDPIGTSKPISLLVKNKTKSYDIVEKTLQKQGYEVTKISLNDIPQSNVDIVSIIDLGGPFFENIADEPYYEFQKFLANLRSSGIFWVTKPCHIRVKDPSYAQVIGLARVIRSELLIDFATCEIDDIAASFSLVGQAFEKFRVRDNEDYLSPDFEYAIEKGIINIGRYLPFVMMDGFIEETDGERMKVVIETPGRLNTLHWIRQLESIPLKDHELEIEMHAVGVNFKDVLVGMNLIDHVGRYHGLEGAGIVRRVGSKVRDFKPGDRVAAMEHNMLSTLLIANEIMCVKIPSSLSFIDAATMFTVYATVQQSLITVGQLKKGQSVLIHSACGGVGLAAIQIAQMIGAKIFATVGSEQKAQYLVENFNIPRNRIFNSRDNSFVEGVHRETNGKGVDQVLNSLSGELLHETWKCVAPYGKLIEIGKRELIGHGRLDMEPFVANRSYCCVDIDAFYDVTMSRFREMMAETLEYLEKGLIKPITIAKEFDASSVAEAFKYMLPGTHIGRVGIRIRDIHGQPTLRNEVSNPPKKLQLDPEGSYLLIGGLGGLGRAISTYMVEHGARNLIYLGRRAGQSDADQAFVGELKSMGVDVVISRGNINELEDVSRAVAEARTPLKGVLQLTAVQADEKFARLTKEQWDYSLAPKVTGTWNLHHATSGIKLDFFLLFSSMSCVIGLPGQANYASGNSFLDAFVQYRNSLGLACSAVDIGPVADVGFLSDRTSLLQTATLTGFKTLLEQEMLESIALSMIAKIPDSSQRDLTFFDPNVFVLGLESTMPLSSPANRAVWRKDRRMAIYHNNSGYTVETTTSSDQLKNYIANTRANPSILKTPEAAVYFAEEIGKRLFGLLLKDERDLNISLALADLGLDSLVAIELRAWWKQAFGFDISVLEMLNMGNLEALGGHVSQRLLQVVAEESKND
ncbi:hypothetical protein BTUL_0001g01140 [Botrytis tulipae]|uniref:Uncharacterized protein n=1 Tax=Botrytis tulipae TaxID=87230 RepID=A0A4Z1F6H4_9HELO|nr:hypothetical protein BTUL_0001g01140 [Botrytis tulipae]